MKKDWENGRWEMAEEREEVNPASQIKRSLSLFCMTVTESVQKPDRSNVYVSNTVQSTK